MCDPELNSRKEPPPRTPLTNCATVDFTRSNDAVHAKKDFAHMQVLGKKYSW